MLNSRKIGAAFFAFACALSAAGSAVADTLSKIDVPSGQLIPALKVLGAQSGVEFVYSTDQLEGLRTEGVRGELTAERALSKLLEGTHLKVTRHESGALLISDSSAAKTSAVGPIEIEQVRIAQSPSENTRNTENTTDSSDPTKDMKNLMVQEIVVTAQKRKERLQDVPISMSVLRGADLDKSTAEGVTETLNRVPGVAANVTHQGGGTQLAIRGVTAGSALFSGSSPVSYYMDSLPFGLVKNAIAPDANSYDLERIEVLRGPQGTLYGASAQNGVVRILTKDADPDQFELKARVATSGTEDADWNTRGDLAINAPIVEGKLAARATLGYQDLSGWIDRPGDSKANDGQIKSLRLKVNAQPTEQLSIGLSAWGSRGDYGAPPKANDNGQNSSLIDESMSTDYNVYGVKMDYDAAAFTVSSMTSYLDYNNTGDIDFAPFGLPGARLFTDLIAHAFSQEVLFNSSQESAWRWSAGAFYRDGGDRLLQNLFDASNNDIVIPYDFSFGSKSHAVFGEIGRRFLGSKLEWKLGLRYFHDRIFVHENISQGGPGTPVIEQKDSFNSTTPRAVLTWFPNSSVTAYASYSEGFRSGFPQDPPVTRAFPTFPSVKPDKLRNYELGAKAQSLDGRLSMDAAVYYINWKDVQQTLVVPFDNTVTTAQINGKSASGPGIDLAVTVSPVNRLELGVNVSWNDLSMDEDVFSGGILLFAQGDRLNLSPEYTLGASVDYAFPLGSHGLEGRLSTSANYTSGQDQRTVLLATSSRSIGMGDNILAVRAKFAIAAPRHWEASLFVDNVTNENGVVSTEPFAIPDWSIRMRPRTIGLQLEYNY